MASNHIMIGTTVPIGSNAMSAVNATREAREQVAKMYGIMVEFADDTTALAAALGIVSETDAALVRTNFQNANIVLQGLDISYFINRLGQ